MIDLELIQNTETSEHSQTSSPERVFMASIIKRAKDDLKYLVSGNKEQRVYGRSAFIWLFLERPENLDAIYVNPSKKRNITITGFESLCRWLDIEPQNVRTYLAEEFDLKFVLPFL